jgi:hypothetical protein
MVRAAGTERGAMECTYLLAGLGGERNMHRQLRC